MKSAKLKTSRTRPAIESKYRYQRAYARCVLKRVDYFFVTKWKYLETGHKRSQSGVRSPSELTRISNNPGARHHPREGIREALTFNGGIYGISGTRSAISPQRWTSSTHDRTYWTRLRKCPIQLDQGADVDTSVDTLPLSVDWTANCLQSDKLQAAARSSHITRRLPH